ncbi:MAG TPA: tRNA epoxyqueuosine(34) reductase QueG [Chitinophagaceae bacterium]|nr:tRNA epoxyqueuosine(34) reductase QueG [Chitinophagaceae bacterium]
MTPSQRSHFVKEEAIRLGFLQCGISQAIRLDNDARRLEKWLQQGRHGTMKYMENYFEQRIDPRVLVPGAKSVITLSFNYFPSEEKSISGFKISKYAYGRDYHDVIKTKLRELMVSLTQQWGSIEGRGFVDSAPVLERAWAQKSGLGWIGKNGNLISNKQGSFFFLATLILDVELEADIPFIQDYCGTCTRCIDACPTAAILPNKEIDGSRCISYYTIELKDAFIQHEKKWEDWIFGCDTCQDVCPWNRFSTPHLTPEFEPRNWPAFSASDWLELTEDVFKKVFKGSPLQRCKWQGVQRNINFVNS